MRLWTDQVGFSGMPLASVSTRVLESRVINLLFNPCKSRPSDREHLRSDIEEGAGAWRPVLLGLLLLI